MKKFLDISIVLNLILVNQKDTYKLDFQIRSIFKYFFIFLEIILKFHLKNSFRFLINQLQNVI